MLPRARQPRKLTRSRIGWLLIGVISLGVTIVLAACEIPAASVVMHVAATRAQLVFDDEWQLHGLAPVRVGLTNADPLQVMTAARGGGPDGPRADRRIASGRAEGTSTWSASLASDYLRIGVAIPPRGHVILALEPGDPRILTVTAAGVDVRGTLDVGAELHLRCTGCDVTGSRDGTAPTPDGTLVTRPARRELSFRGGRTAPLAVRLDLPARDGANALTVGEGLRIRSIRFERDAPGRPASSVSGAGRVEFPGLTLPGVAFQAGDAIQTVPWESLAVRRLVVDDAIRVELEGVVSELRTGPPGVLKSRMPTVLEFIYGSRLVQLALGAALTVGGAITAAAYRLGVLARSDGA